MKAIILLAGYATRLYPLTLNTPKALLEVGNKKILDGIFDEVDKIPGIDEILIVTNHKFYTHFNEWLKGKKTNKPVKIIDDGTMNDEGKLGAIKDINLVIERENITDDIMVLAGDIIFSFDLNDFYNFFDYYKKDSICVYKVKQLNELGRMAVAVLDEGGKVMDIEEKPENPKSNNGATAFYIFRKDTLSLFNEYIQQGNNLEAPGYFIPWLIKRKDVYAFRAPGECIDIGTPNSLREVQEMYKKG